MRPLKPNILALMLMPKVTCHSLGRGLSMRQCDTLGTVISYRGTDFGPAINVSKVFAGGESGQIFAPTQERA